MSDEQMNDCACNEEANQGCASCEDAAKNCACVPDAPKDCACASEEQSNNCCSIGEPSITIPVSYCGHVDVTIGTAELEEWIKDRCCPCDCDCDCEGDGGGEEPGPDPEPEPVKDQFAMAMHACEEQRIFYLDICKAKSGYALCGYNYNSSQAAKGLVTLVGNDLRLLNSMNVIHSSGVSFYGVHGYEEGIVAGGHPGRIVDFDNDLVLKNGRCYGNNIIRGLESDDDFIYACGLDSEIKKGFIYKYDRNLNIINQCNIPFLSQRNVYGPLLDLIVEEDRVVVCGSGYYGMIAEMDKDLNLIRAIGSYNLTSRNSAHLCSITKIAGGYLVVGIASDVAIPSKTAVWVLDHDLNVVNQKGFDIATYSTCGNVLPNGNFVLLINKQDTPSERSRHAFLMEITPELEMVQNISLHANWQHQTSWMDRVLVENDGSVVFGNSLINESIAYVARLGGDWSKFEGQIEQYPDWYLTVDPEPGTFETNEVVLREWDFEQDKTISKENSNVTYTFEPSSLYDI